MLVYVGFQSIGSIKKKLHAKCIWMVMDKCHSGFAHLRLIFYMHFPYLILDLCYQKQLNAQHRLHCIGNKLYLTHC